MLFKSRFWPGLADGSITLAFRRWRRLAVRPGGRYHTPAGVVEVDAVDKVAADDITDGDARRAGYDDRTGLLAELDRHPDGDLYRIVLHHAGADPRVALREDDHLSEHDWQRISARLARLDRASRHGPWTAAALRLIEENPSVRAGDLAPRLGRELLDFKRDIRKLKELGLTESLRTGYRLSPRGRVALDRLVDP